jgi:hypothetical protein
VCIVRRGVHGALEKLIRGRHPAVLGIFLVALTVPALAVTPSPRPSSIPDRINVTKLQSRALLPTQREHTEFVVEINKLGQVTRVRSGKSSKNLMFNAQTYGNVLQAFIRTDDGRVVVGTYRMSYDFDPKTGHVRRGVALISRGGVDPDAQGAALEILSHSHPHSPPPGIPPLDPRVLPDFKNVMQASPTPRHEP